MFATLKRAAKALRVPTPEEMELAYIYEAGDRYDLEARERNLTRRNPQPRFLTARRPGRHD